MLTLIFLIYNILTEKIFGGLRFLLRLLFFVLWGANKLGKLKGILLFGILIRVLRGLLLRLTVVIIKYNTGLL